MNRRPFRNKDIFHDFTGSDGKEYRYTPRTFLDALDDAAQEMNYSNFHNSIFTRIEEIVRRYCSEHDIPLGLSKKQMAHISDRKHAAFRRAVAGGALTKILKALDGRKDVQ